MIARYENEEGVVVDIDETITSIDTLGQTFTYTDETGTPFTIDLRNFETLTSISIDTTAGTITYVDEDLLPTTLNVGDLVRVHETISDIVVDVANQEFTYTNEDGGETTVDITELETTTTVTNTVAGNAIATYTNEDLDEVVINETITSIDTLGQTFTYTDETGTPFTVDLRNFETLTSISNTDTCQRLKVP